MSWEYNEAVVAVNDGATFTLMQKCFKISFARDALAREGSTGQKALFDHFNRIKFATPEDAISKLLIEIFDTFHAEVRTHKATENTVRLALPPWRRCIDNIPYLLLAVMTSIRWCRGRHVSH